MINLSNALLQSSVNSFGSVAMAGYTAANNIFGFLYMSVNAVTQSCMSFTSQNYGVKKLKRMDRVLLDCMILSVGVTLTLGCGAYFFGPELLKIYTVAWKSLPLLQYHISVVVLWICSREPSGEWDIPEYL